MNTFDFTPTVPREFAAMTGCIFHVQITPRAGSGMPLGVGGVSSQPTN
jgi:hypothetical protein